MTIKDSPKEIILRAIRPHVCTKYSCGYGDKPHHAGTYEIDSDVFSEATQATPNREDGSVGGVPFAPD